MSNEESIHPEPAPKAIKLGSVPLVWIENAEAEIAKLADQISAGEVTPLEGVRAAYDRAVAATFRSQEAQINAALAVTRA